jgi:hypothetical protein
MGSSIVIMELVKEVLDSNQKRQCSSCKVIRCEILFWDSKGGKSFKTCELCRNSKNKYRDKKRVEEKETSIKSKSSSSSEEQASSSGEPASSSTDEKPESTVREPWLVDGWKDMTEERLCTMTCEDKELIHICATTKVTALNMIYTCGK